MLKRFLVIVVMGILMPALAMGYEIAGVNLPDSLPAGKESLVLNGAGIRKKLFLKLYVAGLYVKKKDFQC
ncbi:chalcone isomerase family protein [Desulfothermus sp.]